MPAGFAPVLRGQWERPVRPFENVTALRSRRVMMALPSFIVDASKTTLQREGTSVVLDLGPCAGSSAAHGDFHEALGQRLKFWISVGKFDPS